MTARCLFWVQSLLGTGHLRRALLVAEALAEAGLEVTLVNGGPPVPWPTPAGVTLIQLPAVRATSIEFEAIAGQRGEPYQGALREARTDRLRALAARLRPEVVITELFPFGRRAFRGEVLALLDAAPQALILSSVRDVLVSKPEPWRYAWMRDTCRERYAAVLVHGDPALFPFELSFPFAPALADRLHYTGFVHDARVVQPVDAPAVVVSAGGGSVGAALLTAAIAARPHTRLAHDPWLLVTGSQLPPAAASTLDGALPDGIRLARHRDDLAGLMAAAEVSVSQAGYNTVVEGLVGRARMVLVPFAGGEEDEQRRRARRLEGLGLATVVEERDLDPRALAAAIDRAAARPRPEPSTFATDGAARSAAIVLDLLRASRR